MVPCAPFRPRLYHDEKVTYADTDRLSVKYCCCHAILVFLNSVLIPVLEVVS